MSDEGVLAGKEAGLRIDRLTAEQSEIARLRRRLATTEARLARTEVTMEIMGNHENSWSTSLRARKKHRRAEIPDGYLPVADRCEYVQEGCCFGGST